MKKVLATVVALGCLAAAGSVLAGMPSGTGVNGSLHDMNVVVSGNPDPMGRVCVFCHTPHHAVSHDAANSNTYPLWNHDMPDVTSYTPYAWATPANLFDTDMASAMDPSVALIGPSRLCMSCHDGSIAVDQHGEAMAMTGTYKLNDQLNKRAALGKDLTATHPIGFDYNKAATARNLAAGNRTDVTGMSEVVPSTYGFATEITINNDITAQGTYNAVTRPQGANVKLIKDVLYNGNIMTCATCHEVHNKENVKQDYAGNTSGADKVTIATPPNYFLYAKQNHSLICLSCHIK